MGHSRKLLGALLRQYGTPLPKLPWPTPAAARRALDVGDTRAVDGARQILASAWTGEEPWSALPRALFEAFPGSNVVCYGPPSPVVPAWHITNIGGALRPDSTRIARGEKILQFRRYELAKRDPYANRPVDIATIYQRDDELEHFLQGILTPNGLDHQLRTAFYDGDHFSAYVGVYRDGRTVDARRDHAKLHALGPAIRAWVADHTALGMFPFGSGDLTRLLDAVPAPTLLMREGRVAFANQCARRGAVRHNPAVRTTPIELDGRRFEVVTLRADATPKSWFRGLSPSLERTASCLARGASDKDIAAELGVSLRTARTYSQRVLSALGFSSRRELMLHFACQ